MGIEATGHTHWFEAMVAELGHELWMGDAAKIRASVVRKQKTDARDAEHMLDLLRQDRFPQIWGPSLAERDLRQLVCAPEEAGVDAWSGEEPTARAGHQPRSLSEAEAVEREGARRTGKADAVAVGGAGAAEGTAGVAGVGWTGWTSRCRMDGAVEEAGRGGSVRRWRCCAPIRAWGWWWGWPLC